MSIDLDVISSQTTIQTSDDPAKADLELTCDRCAEIICDIEHGDSLAALASSAEEHLRGCSRALL